MAKRATISTATTGIYRKHVAVRLLDGQTDASGRCRRRVGCTVFIKALPPQLLYRVRNEESAIQSRLPGVGYCDFVGIVLNR